MNPLMIANTQIRCDSNRRYCLNDLHQASGGAGRHKPDNWLRSQQAQELVEELGKSEIPFLESEKREAPVQVIQGGFTQGTYAVKELVYAYAMWISAAFHLRVIRAYDALVQQRAAPMPPLAAQPQHRADQLVSAGRIFAAAYRTARIARLQYPQAVRVATDCAMRHTGVDWQAECGWEEANTPLLEDPLRSQVAAALGDRVSFQMEALIAESALGASGDARLMARVGEIARSLGWRKQRRRGASGFITEWRRVCQ